VRRVNRALTRSAACPGRSTASAPIPFMNNFDHAVGRREAFRKQYPNVKIQVEGKGSSTAPPALIENTAQLGPMSRTMKSSEIDAFETKFGYPPTAYPVAVDALALFVNKDNPIKGLTVAEVDALFSKSRRQGHAVDLTKWGQLGLTGDWAACASQSVRPQFCFRHVRIFQGTCTQEWRLQGSGEGTAGLRLGGARDQRRSIRHRVQRDRL
jgi:hypothetical protein